jgi:hypothetical protein
MRKDFEMLNETMITHSGGTHSTLHMPLQAVPVDRGTSTGALATAGGVEADINWGKIGSDLLQNAPSILSTVGSWF